MTPEEIRRHQEKLTRILAFVIAGIVFLLLSAMLWGGNFSESQRILGMTGSIFATVWLYRFLTRRDRSRAAIRNMPFPAAWERILQNEIPFFQSLDDMEKARFRQEIHIFLREKRITGIKTTIDDRVRIFVAASAIIPIFGFPGWEWDQISEVLIYPASFNDHYDMEHGKDRDILGMVGSGAMTRMMILSKPDLLQGFGMPQDRKNVGIHEFAHLLDKSDGAVDGVPSVSLPSKAVTPWLKLVHEEMVNIQHHQSDINPYGLASEAEFFAVASEYFFENPERMQQHHPRLYDMLVRIFHQDPQQRFKKALMRMVSFNKSPLSRNSPCPCGSGKKYKHCCGQHLEESLSQRTIE